MEPKTKRSTALAFAAAAAVAALALACTLGAIPAYAAQVGGDANMGDVSARLAGGDDLFDGDGTPVATTSAVDLSATFSFAHDPASPLAAGDTVTFGLEPEDAFASDWWYVYGSDRARFKTVLDEETGEQIATISWSDNRILTMELTDGAVGKSEVKAVFSDIEYNYSVTNVYSWFEKNPESDRIEVDAQGRKYVDETYRLTLNGKGTGRSFTLRVYQPLPEAPSSSDMRKIEGGYQSDGTIYYELDIATLLGQTNELIVFDTPDVNLHWNYSFQMRNMVGANAKGSYVYSSWQPTPYYNVTKQSTDPSTADEGDFQIWMYDVYYLATREGQDQTRQATYADETQPVTHLDPRYPGERRQLPERYRTSIAAMSVPQDVIATVPAGQSLDADQQRAVDRASAGGSSGLSSADNAGAVGKGFKLVIQNLPHNTGENASAGHYRIGYYLKPVRDSKFANDRNDPLYWNTASYYIQEIPTCRDGDESCRPVSYERSELSQSNRGGDGHVSTETDVPSGKVTGSTSGSRVVVKYRVKGTGDYLADPEVMTGAAGDPYDADRLRKRFEGYVFDSVSPDFAPAQGTFGAKPLTVVLEYIPVPETPDKPGKPDKPSDPGPGKPDEPVTPDKPATGGGKRPHGGSTEVSGKKTAGHKGGLPQTADPALAAFCLLAVGAAATLGGALTLAARRSGR